MGMESGPLEEKMSFLIKKRYRLRPVITSLFVVLLTAFQPTFATAQSADEIVKRADEALKGDRIYSVSRMTVYKSGKAQPVQEMEGYSMEKEGKSYSLSIYTAPNRMKGTANLMIEDDLWVRFGSTGRTRKLSSSAKKNSAGGTDFSYADMGDGGQGISEKYRARLLGAETIEGEDCYKVELLAADTDAPYEKMVVFITKEGFRYLRIDYYEGNANIKSMTLHDFRTVGAKVYPFRQTMENHTKPSVTVVEVIKLEMDSSRVQDRLFTIGYLESIR
jgi:outer membrane lipoprotein-sorting protein